MTASDYLIGHRRGEFHNLQIAVGSRGQGGSGPEEIGLVQGSGTIVHPQAGDAVGPEAEAPLGQFRESVGNAQRGNRINLIVAVGIRGKRRGKSSQGAGTAADPGADIGHESRARKIHLVAGAEGPETHGGRVGENRADGVLRGGDPHPAHGPGDGTDSDQVVTVSGQGAQGYQDAHQKHEDNHRPSNHAAPPIVFILYKSYTIPR